MSHLRSSVFFEDLEVGQEMATSGRTVTEADIVSFAGLSGDYNALHTNEVHAATGPFGRRVAHGLLGLALASGLLARLGILDENVLAFRELTCKFRRPVFIGDTIHAQASVAETKALPRIGGGLVALEVKVYNQQGEIVQASTWKLLVRGKRASNGTQ
jgi:3-hydroxybutyryl-CoA dehydratase